MCVNIMSRNEMGRFEDEARPLTVAGMERGQRGTSETGESRKMPSGGTMVALGMSLDLFVCLFNTYSDSC